MVDFMCDNGMVYQFPDRHCSSCANCSDVFYDYTNGPYLFICNIGEQYESGCRLYKEDNENG